jgi:hypothetical protein
MASPWRVRTTRVAPIVCALKPRSQRLKCTKNEAMWSYVDIVDIVHL